MFFFCKRDSFNFSFKAGQGIIKNIQNHIVYETHVMLKALSAATMLQCYNAILKQISRYRDDASLNQHPLERVHTVFYGRCREHVQC